jgi:hypothetical protein
MKTATSKSNSTAILITQPIIKKPFPTSIKMRKLPLSQHISYLNRSFQRKTICSRSSRVNFQNLYFSSSNLSLQSGNNVKKT